MGTHKEVREFLFRLQATTREITTNKAKWAGPEIIFSQLPSKRLKRLPRRAQDSVNRHATW